MSNWGEASLSTSLLNKFNTSIARHTNIELLVAQMLYVKLKVILKSNL